MHAVEAVLDEIDDGFVVSDASRVVTRINLAGRWMLGLGEEPEGVVGGRCADVVPYPELCAAVARAQV